MTLKKSLTFLMFCVIAAKLQLEPKSVNNMWVYKISSKRMLQILLKCYDQPLFCIRYEAVGNCI